MNVDTQNLFPNLHKALHSNPTGTRTSPYFLKQAEVEGCRTAVKRLYLLQEDVQVWSSDVQTSRISECLHQPGLHPGGEETHRCVCVCRMGLLGV